MGAPTNQYNTTNGTKDAFFVWRGAGWRTRSNSALRKKLTVHSKTVNSAVPTNHYRRELGSFGMYIIAKNVGRDSKYPNSSYDVMDLGNVATNSIWKFPLTEFILMGGDGFASVSDLTNNTKGSGRIFYSMNYYGNWDDEYWAPHYGPDAFPIRKLFVNLKFDSEDKTPPTLSVPATDQELKNYTQWVKENTSPYCGDDSRFWTDSSIKGRLYHSTSRVYMSYFWDIFNAGKDQGGNWWL